jgi:hypothetical protein
MQGRRMLLQKKNIYPLSGIESTASHICANSGRSIVKGDGNGVA